MEKKLVYISYVIYENGIAYSGGQHQDVYDVDPEGIIDIGEIVRNFQDQENAPNLTVTAICIQYFYEQ